MKVRVERARIRVVVRDVLVEVDDFVDGQIETALRNKLEKQLTLLDITGGRTGYDGIVSNIEVELIDERYEED